MRCNAYSVHAMLSMMAGVSTCEVYAEDIKDRVSPEVYEEFRSSILQTRGLVQKFLNTFPPEKQQGIKNQARGSYISIQHAKPASPDKQYVVIEGEDFEAIVLAAREKCFLCSNWNECHKCKLGKAMDKTLATDRDGRSWGAIDISEDGYK